MFEDYFDLDRRPRPLPPDRLDAVANMTAGVCTPHHLAFVSDVVQAGGCFTGGQAELWLGIHFPGWSDGYTASQAFSERQRFLEPLFLATFQGRSGLRGLAEPVDLYPSAGARFAQLTYTKLYRVLGLGRPVDNRTDMSPYGRIARLLSFDYLASLDEPWTWYGTSARQLGFLRSVGVPDSVIPAANFGSAKAGRKGFLAHSLLLGLRGWRVRFVLPLPVKVAVSGQIHFFATYARLFAALRARGLYVELVLLFRNRPEQFIANWCRDQAVPPSREDRVRFAHFLENYALRRSVSQGDYRSYDVYGGGDGYDARLGAIEKVLSGPAPANRPMEVSTWCSGRFAADNWVVPPQYVYGGR